MIELSGSRIFNLVAPEIFKSRVKDESNVLWSDFQITSINEKLRYMSTDKNTGSVNFYPKQINPLIGLENTLKENKSIRFVFIPIEFEYNKYNFGHESLLVIDMSKKEIYHFDSSDKVQERGAEEGYLHEQYRIVGETLKTRFQLIQSFKNFIFKWAPATYSKRCSLALQRILEDRCPGIVKGIGYCATWVFIFAEFRVKLPHLTVEQIEKELLNSGCIGMTMVKEYQELVYNWLYINYNEELLWMERNFNEEKQFINADASEEEEEIVNRIAKSMFNYYD